MNYDQYIRSAEWKAKSEATIEARGRACEECGRAETLGVHHVSYERLGQEREEDLKVLCVLCHSLEHAGRLVRHGRVGCVSLIFTGKARDGADSTGILFCVTGARQRRQIVRIDEYRKVEGSHPQTVFADVVDLFEERARYAVLKGIALAVGDDEAFFAELRVLNLVPQIPVIDERDDTVAAPPAATTAEAKREQ